MEIESIFPSLASICISLILNLNLPPPPREIIIILFRELSMDSRRGFRNSIAAPLELSLININLQKLK